MLWGLGGGVGGVVLMVGWEEPLPFIIVEKMHFAY